MTEPRRCAVLTPISLGVMTDVARLILVRRSLQNGGSVGVDKKMEAVGIVGSVLFKINAIITGDVIGYFFDFDLMCLS
jgi:hypothetical protein